MNNKNYLKTDEVKFSELRKIFRIVNLMDNTNGILFALSVLYSLDIITLEKLKGQLSSLKEGELQKYKKTYHCSINDKWYNDCPSYEVFNDLMEQCISDSQVVNLKQILSIVMLYTGKNHNYCLNFIKTNFIDVIIKDWISSHYKYFSNFLNEIHPSLSNLELIYVNGSCDYCGHSSDIVDIRRTFEISEEKVSILINSYKKKKFKHIR